MFKRDGKELRQISVPDNGAIAVSVNDLFVVSQNNVRVITHEGIYLSTRLFRFSSVPHDVTMTDQGHLVVLPDTDKGDVHVFNVSKEKQVTEFQTRLPAQGVCVLWYSGTVMRSPSLITDRVYCVNVNRASSL